MPVLIDSTSGMLELTPEAALAVLAGRGEALLAEGPDRRVLGIAGGPGVGKSTLAGRLVEMLNAAAPGRAALVPMDGFHIRHAKLESLGLVDDKGAPQTFEGAAFVAFLARLKAAGDIMHGPGYSRRIEDVVDEAYAIGPEVRLLVVEGNYLLLADPPWDAVRPLLDLAVFLHLPPEMVEARLMRRHAEQGLFTEARNRAHIARTDMPNYALVERHRARADLAIALVTEQ